VSQCVPLTYPPTWPEVQKRTFLLGVPIVGADHRAHRNLCQQVRIRTVACLTAWGTDPRRVSLASFASHELQRVNHYPHPYFIPTDPFGLIAWDFTAGNVDHGFLDGAIERIQEHLHTSLPVSEWQAFLSLPYGSVIDALLQAPLTPGA
jgi:hypothetical protein